jgi:release factor glutamine methyltransferase
MWTHWHTSEDMPSTSRREEPGRVAPARSELLALTSRLRGASCVRAEDEAALLLAQRWEARELEQRVRRREAGEPLEWILGWAQFGDLRLAIDPGVFVPRQRTVALARAAVARLTAAAPPRVLIDVGTGCGVIACVAARDCPGATVVAADIDPAAVACAARNGGPHGVEVVRSDLLDGVPARLRGRVDALVANVPYVPDAELGRLPVDAREWEPRQALAGGPDGLSVLRRLAAQAGPWLRPGGALLCELSPGQAARVADELHAVDVELVDDEETAIVTLRPPPRAWGVVADPAVLDLLAGNGSEQLFEQSS